MKSHRFTHVAIIILCACVFAFAGIRSTRRTSAQTKTSSQSNGLAIGSGNAVNGVKPAAAADSKAGAYTPVTQAAIQNAELQTSLVWVFGGKSQRGWSLYVPLIANLIGSDANAEGNPFAARLALWQKENGAEQTGVLEAGTWSRMVLDFQSRRLGSQLSPAPDQLVTIPITDCYDPTRAEELRKAERETFAAYKRMVAAAAADSSLGLKARDGQLAPDEKFLRIISAFRSREYQDQLRRQSPNSGRAGLAINSPHATGRALDLYVGGEPVNTKDDNRALQTRGAVYRWLVKNAARFGFQPYFYEPWHWEYVGK
jgi:zinc D-Ala-D-Ala carboxypeptidase